MFKEEGVGHKRHFKGLSKIFEMPFNEAQDAT